MNSRPPSHVVRHHILEIRMQLYYTSCTLVCCTLVCCTRRVRVHSSLITVATVISYYCSSYCATIYVLYTTIYNSICWLLVVGLLLRTMSSEQNILACTYYYLLLLYTTVLCCMIATTTTDSYVSYSYDIIYKQNVLCTCVL
jgi:hypothetical protein